MRRLPRRSAAKPVWSQSQRDLARVSASCSHAQRRKALSVATPTAQSRRARTEEAEEEGADKKEAQEPPRKKRKRAYDKWIAYRVERRIGKPAAERPTYDQLSASYKLTPAEELQRPEEKKSADDSVLCLIQFHPETFTLAEEPVEVRFATRSGSCRHECLIGCDTMMMMMLAPMNA